MKSTMKSTGQECPAVLDDEFIAEFGQVATIRDKLAFSALMSRIIDIAVQRALARQRKTGSSGTTGEIPSFRGAQRWEPSATEIQRGRVLTLKEFRKPHNLPVIEFALLAGKSRQQIYKDVEMRRLLALSIGARGQRIPDWQLDPVRKNLTQTLLERAPDVDKWTLYYALSEPNQDFSGKSPIKSVTVGNMERILGTLLSQLGIRD